MQQSSPSSIGGSHVGFAMSASPAVLPKAGRPQQNSELQLDLKTRSVTSHAVFFYFGLLQSLYHFIRLNVRKF